MPAKVTPVASLNRSDLGVRNADQRICPQGYRAGFFGAGLHDLRGTHETLLLDDAGVPVHVVAGRCGHDPTGPLRAYAKRTRKADTSAAAVIGTLSKNVLSGG